MLYVINFSNDHPNGKQRFLIPGEVYTLFFFLKIDLNTSTEMMTLEDFEVQHVDGK